MVKIDGLNKASVIQALYAASRPQGMGFLHYTEGELPRAEAESLVGRFIDYLHGRAMKVQIKDDSFDETWFDRDNGDGAAQKVIDALRAGDVKATTSAIHEAGKAKAAAIVLDDMGRAETTEKYPGMVVHTIHAPDDPRLREAIEKATAK